MILLLFYTTKYRFTQKHTYFFFKEKNIHMLKKIFWARWNNSPSTKTWVKLKEVEAAVALHTSSKVVLEAVQGWVEQVAMHSRTLPKVQFTPMLLTTRKKDEKESLNLPCSWAAEL